MISPIHNSSLLLLSLAVSVATFGFILYQHICESAFVKKILKIGVGTKNSIIFQRFTGVVIFGLLSILCILFFSNRDISEFGLKAPNRDTIIWILILAPIIIFLNYVNAKSPENLAMYPQIREKKWSINLLIISAITWILYLLAYEFLFRGFLFFSAIPVLGLWPAIILNTGIYALVHLPKGSKETIGAIPLGIVLCYLTYLTESFWVAFISHIFMALSNEWFSLYKHPEMSIKK